MGKDKEIIKFRLGEIVTFSIGESKYTGTLKGSDTDTYWADYWIIKGENDVNYGGCFNDIHKATTEEKQDFLFAILGADMCLDFL